MEELIMYKTKFKTEFYRQLSDANIDIESFCGSDIDSLRSYLSKKDRNISMQYIIQLETELKKTGLLENNGVCTELRNLWVSIERLQHKRNRTPFWDLNREELLWVTNNLQILRNIPIKYISFLIYIHALNYFEKEKIFNIIYYLTNLCELDIVPQNLPLENSFAKSNPPELPWTFINIKDYTLTDEFDCFYITDQNDLELGKREETVAIIKGWLDFQNIDIWDKWLFHSFISYDKERENELSKEQAAIMGIVLTIYYERQPHQSSFTIP